MAASRYPNGIDIMDVITADQVGKHAGVPSDVAAAAVHAHRFGTAAVAASGGSVVLFSGVVWGLRDSAVQKDLRSNLHTYFEQLDPDDRLANLVAAKLPLRSGPPRFDPVLESELAFLSVDLAQSLRPELDEGQITAALEAWWDLTMELGLKPVEELPTEVIVERRPWDVSEKKFEDWLEKKPGSLLGGVELEIVKRQWRTPVNTVADLLCRVVDGGDSGLLPGDLLVVENKAGEAAASHVDQLMGYVEHALALRSPGQAVVGVLAATGIGDSADAAAEAAGVITRTWGQIGFLDRVWNPGSTDEPIADFLDVLNDGSPWQRESL